MKSKQEKENIKSMKKLLLNSLINDLDSWIIKGYGATDLSWLEFLGKSYGEREEEIIFCVTTLDKRVHVYINGEICMQFEIYPFTKLSKAIRNMKKHVISKDSRVFEDKIAKIIKANKENI